MTQVDQFFMSPPDQFLMSFDSGRRGQLFGPSCSLTNTLLHTRAAAVLVDEFNACGFECAPNDIQGRATRLTNPRFKLMRTWSG